jgi:AcrR family transcriptional regulator
MARKRTIASDNSDHMAADQIREDILRAATSEFAEHGFVAARIEGIAERMQTSKRMIYYYFGDKKNLYHAVLTKEYSGIREAESTIDLDTLPPIIALRRLVEVTIDYHAAHRDFVRLSMDANIRLGDDIREISKAAHAMAIVDKLDRLLRRGEREGCFRQDIDAKQILLMLSALAFYPVSNRHSFLSNFEYDTFEPAIRDRHRAAAADALVHYCRA